VVVVEIASVPVGQRARTNTERQPFLFACHQNSRARFEAFIRKAKCKLPLFLVGKPTKAQ
jgi:hypothetical protein